MENKHVGGPANGPQSCGVRGVLLDKHSSEKCIYVKRVSEDLKIKVL